MSKVSNGLPATAVEAEKVALAAIAAQQSMSDRRAAAAAELAKAEARLAELAIAVSAGGPEADFEKAADEVSRLRTRLETYDDQVLPSANRNVEASEARAAEARRHDAYMKAKRLADAAAAELVAQFPTLSALLTRLQAQIAEADAAVERVNSDLPHGMPPLPEPEGRVRDQQSRDEEAVDETTVECWAFTTTGVRLTDEQVAQVRQHEGGGAYLSTDGAMPASASRTAVEKRSFRRVEIHPAQDWRKGGRLGTIDLGSLTVPTANQTRVRFELLPRD